MLLYAETHYPRRLPSFIRRDEPEIVVDLPWRVEPGHAIPVLLVVRDAHWFPVRIDRLQIEVVSFDLPDTYTGTAAYDVPIHAVIREPWWWRLIELPPPETPGEYRISPEIHYALDPDTGAERKRIALADNYRGTRHTPFRVEVAAHPWPVPDGWTAGDTHVHTDYTRDQVEFGPPVAAIAAMSRAMGVDWVALTDHSYDLDDAEDTYLRNDPNLPRWHALARDVSEHDGDPLLILGEEVSCGNSRGENVHLLALGIDEFIPGTGDGAERATVVRPELTIPQVARRIRAQGGVAIAAHPGERPTWFERISLHRGRWHDTDLARPELDAAQIWSGTPNAGFHRAYAAWIRQLLRGRHIAAVAGSDSHGSFGRFRQVRIPWIQLVDNRNHLFASVRTVVQALERTHRAVLDAITSGRSYLTDGPEITFTVTDGQCDYGLGEVVNGSPNGATVIARSIPEFGSIREIRLAIGFYGAQEEEWLPCEVMSGLYSAHWEVPLGMKKPGYIRAEVRTTTNRFAFTNPIRVTG